MKTEVKVSTNSRQTDDAHSYLSATDAAIPDVGQSVDVVVYSRSSRASEVIAQDNPAYGKVIIRVKGIDI